MAADICRLCLRPIDKAKSIDLVAETTKFAMLKEFLPEMNLDITENTQVCRNCMQELEVSYNFKQSVVVNEANIQTKLEENKLKKIDLKLMLDDVAKKELKEDDYVCRTCLLICRTPSIHLFDTPSNMMPCSFVKKMCQLVFELEFIASDKPVLCDECWETLQTVYNFRKCCLKTDKKLRTYVAKKNLKKLGVEEFKKFVEENPPIDNDEVSSDDELDGYIKEEPIDEEELKFDPEEASCSSASLKFKEETTVKSESDEDMEDEPELLDPKALKSETSELDGEDCKLEIGDVKVDAEGEGAAGPSGNYRLIDTSSFNSAETLSTTPLFRCIEWLPSTNRSDTFRVHKLEHRAPDTGRDSIAAEHSYNKRNTVIIHLPTGAPFKKFRCDKCPYETKRKSVLKKHEVRHFSAPVYNCAECSYQTEYKNMLCQHLARHSRPTFYCKFCSYNTKAKENFDAHVLLHDPSRKTTLYECSECSYKTIIRSSLNRHKLKHSAPATTSYYYCTDCTFKAKRKDFVKKHMLLHLKTPKDKRT